MDCRQKILDRDRLAGEVARRRESGQRVVFTNGCFDLLHVGHSRYLEKARALGDCLVVALNSDASVQRLKGDKRPILPESHRTRVIAALDCVDYVTVFDEDDPIEIIRQVEPDVLCKGGDYEIETILGRREVWDRGGEVKVIPLEEGSSTRELIDRIVDINRAAKAQSQAPEAVSKPYRTE